VQYLTTGDRAFDDVLGGGLAAGSMVVLAGAPGTGKTILAQQICFANATPERKAIYFTTWSEPHDKLVRHLAPFSFFDRAALGDRVEFVHLTGLIQEPGTGLAAVADEILRRSFASKPSVVVIDSSKALHDVVDPEEFRRSIYDLASKVAFTEAVLILVGEYTVGETRASPEFAVADAIVQLENEAHGPIDRRWLRVLKMRGGDPAPGQHSIRLSKGGFEVSPRLETTLPAVRTPVSGRCGLGVDGLDALVGGGFPRGDSVLFLGPTGVGKTLLALHFLRAGVESGERCLHLTFQESPEQVRGKAAATGWEWDSRVGELLAVHHVPPVEVNLDEVGALVRDELRQGDVKRVVVDSLAELAFAAQETDRLPGYVWALAGFIRAAGGTTVFTNELASLGGNETVGGLSFLFDDVLFLRYIEIASEIRRALSVFKMRQSEHDRALSEFEIGAKGIVLGDRIREASGVLGWSALRSSET
jgi:circadian clock protein KaiC